MNEKLTLQYLIEALTKRHQMDPKDADAFVKAFFELIRLPWNEINTSR